MLQLPHYILNIVIQETKKIFKIHKFKLIGLYTLELDNNNLNKFEGLFL